MISNEEKKKKKKKRKAMGSKNLCGWLHQILLLLYHVSFKTFEFFLLIASYFFGWVCLFFLFYNVDVIKIHL